MKQNATEGIARMKQGAARSKTTASRRRSILSRQSRSIHVSQGERLVAIRDVLMDLTKAECPCADCMGAGCAACLDTGADLESLMSIKRAVAKVLEIMEKSKLLSTKNIARELVHGEDRCR